eukprot:gnl/MRDRNA2_/MRDRNA2_166768_c0_seq1.p1 gnl/MRDRNA2_/MRDRNA2_166768_c0~~gnl/MRDRNA2_/MRDRNA2_166768_c0_seq1.p1  ORF type:complete len:196 (-),score=20.46 gnl/MRDRNA2_/MRDRNA2_166768_c0_seq1:90-677(-)
MHSPQLGAKQAWVPPTSSQIPLGESSARRRKPLPWPADPLPLRPRKLSEKYGAGTDVGRPALWPHGPRRIQQPSTSDVWQDWRFAEQPRQHYTMRPSTCSPSGRLDDRPHHHRTARPATGSSVVSDFSYTSHELPACQMWLPANGSPGPWGKHIHDPSVWTHASWQSAKEDLPARVRDINIGAHSASSWVRHLRR